MAAVYSHSVQYPANGNSGQALKDNKQTWLELVLNAGEKSIGVCLYSVCSFDVFS